VKEDRNRPMPVEVPSHQCPKCKQYLAFLSAKLDIFPYLHVDLHLGCMTCRQKFLFDVPFDHEAGLQTYIFTNNLIEGAIQLTDAEQIHCPLDDSLMIRTKVIATDKDNKPVIQHKCPSCYLVRHFAIEDTVIVPVGADPEITERLRRLGYIE